MTLEAREVEAEEKRREINNPAASLILGLSVFVFIFIPFIKLYFSDSLSINLN